MIISIRSQASSEERAHLLALLGRVTGHQRAITPTIIDGREVIAMDGNQLDAQAGTLLREERAVERVGPVKTSYKLVSRSFRAEGSSIQVGAHSDSNAVTIGSTNGSPAPVIIAGPCAVENREQLLVTAKAVQAAGAQVLRGGAFKPRTSPYQFQGLGLEGLRLLAEAREMTGMPVITEVMEPELVETVAEYADILQIGSRNMQNFPLLLAAGRHSQGRPERLKRGVSATIDEWLLAAEYVVAAGNPNVILCERCIRSLDPQTRNVLDLTSIPLLRNLTHLPVIFHPSHPTRPHNPPPPMPLPSTP